LPNIFIALTAHLPAADDMHKPWLDRWLVTASAHFVDSLCPFCRSFGCVLLSNQIYFVHNVPIDNITLIYLINLPWKLGLGLGLDLKMYYFSIFQGE